MKTALICGITGQDGAYLARFLLNKGYRVVGTSRSAQIDPFGSLARLDLLKQIEVLPVLLSDFSSINHLLTQLAPDEIYNLAGQSSVSLSFKQPLETISSINFSTLNLLENLRLLDMPARLYNASSSECFGNTGSIPADENTAFNPRSPYGVAKAAGFWAVRNYREAYGLFTCSGILFNHESPLRPAHFVTQKIVQTACRIACGSNERLTLGNLNVQRDWGWAPDYVEAMWMMLQQSEPEDFVIATGKTYSLEQFVQEVFVRLGLNWQEHVDLDASLLRLADLTISHANPARARHKLGWSAQLTMPEIIQEMIAATLKEVS